MNVSNTNFNKIILFYQIGSINLFFSNLNIIAHDFLISRGFNNFCSYYFFLMANAEKLFSDNYKHNHLLINLGKSYPLFFNFKSNSKSNTLITFIWLLLVSIV